MITSHSIDPIRLVKSMWGRILIIAIYSSFAVVYTRSADSPLFEPIAIPAILGTLLSILLGFMTSAAYDRWWEARKIWGAIVNDSRTFTRQVITFVSPRSPGDEGAVSALHRDLVYRHMAWVYTLSDSLRGQETPQDLDAYLFRGEVEELMPMSNRPNALLQRQGEQLRSALDAERLDPFRFLSIESTIGRLTDHMGRCERIKNTVFPVHYRYLISRVTWIFALLLPWALILSVGWVTVPITVVTVTAFWMIEGIGTALVDPFENRPSGTPMTAISQTIEIDLRQQLGESEVPAKLPPVDGILM